MEAHGRQLTEESTPWQRLLVLAGAAVISLAAFALLFVATADLTGWVVRGGFAHYHQLSRAIRVATAILPSLMGLFAGSVIAVAGYRKQRSRLRPHRPLDRRPARMPR